MHATSNASALPAVAVKAEPKPVRSWSFQVSKLLLGVVCLTLVALLGYLDYLTGYEQSLLLFYLVPIAIATWFGGLFAGLAISLASMLAWVFSDLSAGIPAVGAWNLAMASAAYLVFSLLLSKLRSVLGELEDRVRERTKELRHALAERERLDREIAAVADRERRRLGQDLHDSLCQHLTGTALTAQALREKLAARAAGEVKEADKVVRYIDEGIEMSRNLARGFFSPEMDPEGLMVALEDLAENMSARFGVACTFHSEGVVQVPDSSMATQLYRIAQEAVMNAIKHADAAHVNIRLDESNSNLKLSVSDDGIGLPEKLPQRGGLGLRLMSHGAALVGADFQISRNGDGGTTVTCTANVATEET